MFLKYRAAAARASADRDHPAVGAGRVRRIVTAIGLGMSLAVPAPAMADEASFAAHDSLTSQHWDGTGTGSYTFDDPSVGRRASISIIGGSLPIITLDSSMQGGAAFFDNYSDFAMSARYRYNVYVLGRTASETAALNHALVGADTNQVIGSAKGSYKLSANRNASIAQVQLSSRTQSLYATISNGTFWGTGRADELNSYSLDLRANDYVFCRDIGCTDTPAIELSMFAFTRMYVDLDLETGGVKGGHTYAFIDPMIELNRDFFLASGLDPDAYSLSLTPTLEATVPEPKGWAMMLLGFGGLGWTLRRRVRVGASVRFA